MPTIPLYTIPSHPDAWHRVRGPGGYECWHFDADDPATDRQIVVSLFQGSPFDRVYLRRYRRYRRFPTRIAPPLPEQFPAARVAMYERGQVRFRAERRFPPDAFTAAVDRPDVALGPVRVAYDDGQFQLLVDASPGFRARLSFRPARGHPPLERVLAPEHRWIVSGPPCHVDGTIDLGGEHLHFTGAGYRDHHFGTAPPAIGGGRWMRGRALSSAGACAFVLILPADPAQGERLQLIECDAAAGARETPVPLPRGDWSRRTPLWLSFPERLAFGDVLDLREPRILEASAARAVLGYRATWRGLPARAMCEVAHFDRRRLPILGRLAAR